MKGWVQIGSRKPTEGQHVLGFDSDLSQAFVFVYRAGNWHHQNEEHFHGLNVTHWQPLPEPPRRKRF